MSVIVGTFQRLKHMNVEEDKLAFERQKWSEEAAFKERELALQEKAATQSQWYSPIALAIAAAAAAGVFNGGVAWMNGQAQVQLEDRKSEQARILEMIKGGAQKTTRLNLQFLISAGLIDDPKIKNDLEKYLLNTPDRYLPNLVSFNYTLEEDQIYISSPTPDDPDRMVRIQKK